MAAMTLLQFLSLEQQTKEIYLSRQGMKILSGGVGSNTLMIVTPTALVQAYIDAANEGAIETLLGANALALNLVGYNALDAAGQTAVATALL